MSTALALVPDAPAATPDPRWSAILARDPSADGSLIYGVRTTGVCCRPSCRSRTPNRANVVFFPDLPSALRAGFRPCKRCRPEAVDPRVERAGLVARACRLLEAEEGPTGSSEVARSLGLSAGYFQRWFRAAVGVTPQAYRRRVLVERAKEALPSSRSVLEAAFAGGLGSATRFYAGAARELGMSPRAARRGGSEQDVRYATRRSALGRVLVAWTRRGVCHIALGDTDAEAIAELEERFPHAQRERAASPRWVAEAIAAVDGSRKAGLPLDIQGTAFQERVWQALRAIPSGETRTYSELARSLGAPRSARAVARAVASNRLAVVIPCHRVVRADGKVGGYRWGPKRKRQLVEREAAARALL